MLEKPKKGMKIKCVDNNCMTGILLEKGEVYTFLSLDEKVKGMIRIEEYPNKSFCEYRFEEYK